MIKRIIQDIIVKGDHSRVVITEEKEKTAKPDGGTFGFFRSSKIPEKEPEDIRVITMSSKEGKEETKKETVKEIRSEHAEHHDEQIPEEPTKSRKYDFLKPRQPRFTPETPPKTKVFKETFKEGKNSIASRFLNGKFIFTFLVFILIAVVGSKAISAFSKVFVRITPHQETINVDAVFKAGVAGDVDIRLQSMELNLAKQKEFAATGVKNQETKATGQIVVFNAFSPDAQALVKSTRFETPDGKIYRLDAGITVPGAKVDGSDVIPGSIAAKVTADAAGESYNIGLTDFTLPALKGTARYEKMYARSKTPMTGGFKGQMPVIADGNLTDLSKGLEAIIKEELLGKAKLQKPEDYLFYEGAAKINFDDSSNALIPNTGSNTFVLRKTGVLSAFLISKDQLAQVLTKKYLSEDLKAKVRIDGMENLTFELVNRDDQSQTMLFKLKGAVKAVWIIDQEKLKESLLASSKKIQEIFQAYPDIDSATAVFQPSWWRFIPKSKSRIIIEEVL